jgi:hypothetical protein
MPKKIYGTLTAKAIRVWNTYVTSLQNKDGSVGAMFTGHSGMGKALAENTPIRVLNGWKPIKDIKVGDAVISRSGHVTKVLGVYPQGIVDLYDIVFEDDRTIRCCGKHLWPVSYNGFRNVKNTESILHIMEQQDVYIPLCDPVFNTHYSTRYDATTYGRKVVAQTVERIPSAFLDNEKEVRQDLFNNIFNNKDTIVYDNKTVYQFKTTNIMLADDVCILAYSLGYIAKKVVDGDTISLLVYKDPNGLRIKSITRVDPGKAICIEVADEEHLYIADNYIVTHNTEVTQIIANYGIDNGIPVISFHSIKPTLAISSKSIITLPNEPKNFTISNVGLIL